MILFFIKLSILRREQAQERVVNSLVLLDNHATSPTANRTSNERSEEGQNYDDNGIERENSQNSEIFADDSRRERKRKKKAKDRYTRTDITFLCVFPVMFIIFNIFYWGSLYVWRSTNIIA